MPKRQQLPKNCNRVTHLLHTDAGTACLRGARYAPTDPMEGAKRALDGSQPVDGARELEPRTLVQNRHLAGLLFTPAFEAMKTTMYPKQHDHASHRCGGAGRL